MTNYKQFNLLPLDKVKKPRDVSRAWDKYVIKYESLPPAIAKEYHDKLYSIIQSQNLIPKFRKNPDFDKLFSTPLNQEQIDKLNKLVEDNVTAYMYETMGYDIPKGKIKELRKKKIISRKITRSSFPEDMFLYGRAIHLLESGVDFYHALQMARRMPLTNIDRVAIEHLKNNSCKAVSGMANKYVGDIKGIIEAKNRQYLADMIAEGIEKRLTYKEIASEIGHQTGDWARDLFRIVYTEGHTAKELAVAMDMKQKFGTHPVTGQKLKIAVAKSPEPGACEYCLKLYVNPDGSLKKYYLDDLLASPLMNTPYYDNQGQFIRRQASKIGSDKYGWLPVIGATHPYCRCKLIKYWKHQHDRDYINELIKSGEANKSDLRLLDQWQSAYIKAWG